MRPIPRTRLPKAGRPPGKFTQHRRLDKLRETLESNPAGLALEDLAMLLRVTTRSVRRYLQELELITELESVETTPGGAHLWRIKPSERGRSVTLRRTQAYCLLAARKIFEVMRGSALYDEVDLALRQVLQIAQRPAKTKGDVPSDHRLEDRFVYVPNPPRSYAKQSEELDDLFQAVAELRAVRMRYRRADKIERVILEPYAMVIHRGAVFCVARDALSDEVLPFQLDRMSDVERTGEGFTLPADFDVHDHFHGELGLGPRTRGTRVLVEFDPRAGEEVRARRVHPTQKVATASDGRVRLSMTVADLEEVKSWVLGFGSSARVIEPPELAADVMRELRRSLARYGGK
jgi:predicted DNA-binding transcriptional regulator YafY